MSGDDSTRLSRLLLSRLGDDETDKIWMSAGRTKEEQSEQFGRAVGIIPPDGHLSHNAAFLCERGGMLVAYGGRWRPRRSEIGIRRTSAWAADFPELRWTKPEVVVHGLQPGCREEREIFRAQGCEFDGKLSVVKYRKRYLLYVRANLNATGGGRHVQVTSSANGRDGWRPFELVSVEGLDVTADNAEKNIYFFVVRKHSRGLVSLFPAVLGAAGGIFCAFSQDGVAWSRPRLLLSSAAAHQRTSDHPVDWITSVAQGTVEVHIEHAISTTRRAEPFHCVYTFNHSSIGPPAEAELASSRSSG
mmetsp:Transcript_49275/g.105240  ORF Transcript_49275/g.105240 Transcript_49275/m.105240 type:complete len:303 (-) Transcript_49275:391-1299(-)